MSGLSIAFFGSSLVSSWWNGACTYYRGIIRALDTLGYDVTFYEPIAYDRQEHRDIDDPDYARVIVYDAPSAAVVRDVVASAAGVDVVVKCSGVGVYDDVLEDAVASLDASARIFWDVDAPATLARLENDRSDPLRALLASYDAVFTYGGGEPVVSRYRALGARDCHVVYNAFDPSTHFRVEPVERFAADCSLLANRLPDREDRVDEFFFRAASLCPDKQFLLGGNGWDDKPMPRNVRWVGHVGTGDHNAFNCSPVIVLNVTRDSMVTNGWSPATRVFEAAGVGACLISDVWPGVDEFLTAGSEVLLAEDGAEVAQHVSSIDPLVAHEIGARALVRVVRDHTYDQRAAQVDALLRALVEVAA